MQHSGHLHTGSKRDLVLDLVQKDELLSMAWRCLEAVYQMFQRREGETHFHDLGK